MNNKERLQTARNNLQLAQTEYDAAVKDHMFLLKQVKNAKLHLRSAEVLLAIAEDRHIVNEDVQAEVLFWVESVHNWIGHLGTDGRLIWPATVIETVYDAVYDKEYDRAVSRPVVSA